MIESMKDDKAYFFMFQGFPTVMKRLEEEIPDSV